MFLLSCNSRSFSICQVFSYLSVAKVISVATNLLKSGFLGPKMLFGVILYFSFHGIISSHKLEYYCFFHRVLPTKSSSIDPASVDLTRVNVILLGIHNFFLLSHDTIVFTMLLFHRGCSNTVDDCNHHFIMMFQSFVSYSTLPPRPLKFRHYYFFLYL